MIYEKNMKLAYSEVYIFLNMLGKSYIEKISNTVYETIKNNRDLSYKPNIQVVNGNINYEFSREALALISALNLQYFCNSEIEKHEYMKTYIENEKEEQERLRELYNPYKKFKKLENTTNTIKENSLIEIKKENTFVKKIKQFILKIFKK